MKTAWQFIKDFSPIIVFYIVVGLIVVFGVLKHPELWVTQPPAQARQPFMPNGSDTVPNNISCQFRGAEFCHPKEFNV